jgi:hypothetical protein
LQDDRVITFTVIILVRMINWSFDGDMSTVLQLGEHSAACGTSGSLLSNGFRRAGECNV